MTVTTLCTQALLSAFRDHIKTSSIIWQQTSCLQVFHPQSDTQMHPLLTQTPSVSICALLWPQSPILHPVPPLQPPVSISCASTASLAPHPLPPYTRPPCYTILSPLAPKLLKTLSHYFCSPQPLLLLPRVTSCTFHVLQAQQDFNQQTN